MTAILTAALIGGLLLYFLRNDTDELGLGRTPWVLASMAFFTACAYLGHPDVRWFEMVGVVGLLGFLLTYAHGPILSPPSQPYSDTPDLIDKTLMRVFRATPGQEMKLASWSAYAFVRYVAPFVGLAALLGSPVAILGGILSVLGYYPFAYLVASGERTKYVGAVVFGMSLGGILVAQI